MAESGEKRSAMMGMHRKRSHELRSVLADLREWVEHLVAAGNGGSAASALFVSVVCAEGAATLTAPALPQFATRHSTPNTQQVREQVQTHAFMSRSRKERTN